MRALPFAHWISKLRSVTLSPEQYRRLTRLAVVALAFIIVTGSAVRLTDSGLGCSDWPTCEDNRVVAPLERHAMVEFVNRTITGLVSAAVVLAVLGALARRPRRQDLVWLAWGLVAGVAGQVVLGGMAVMFELTPPLVMAHFAASMVLVANAVVLHHLAGEGGSDPRPVVAPEVRSLSRCLLGAAVVVILTGTVVTGAGPHGGDPDVERLPFFVPDVARIHSGAVVLFLAGVLSFLWLLRRTGAPADVHARARTLLVVLVAQAGVGYTQYFTGVPVVLVGVHVLGAVLVWVAVLRLHLGLTRRFGAETTDQSAVPDLIAAPS